MPSGMQAPALIWAAAFLVGAGAVLARAVYMVKYPFIRRYHPAMLERAFWDDRLLFLLLSAGAMGAGVGRAVGHAVPGAARRLRADADAGSAAGVQMLGRLGGLRAAVRRASPWR